MRTDLIAALERFHSENKFDDYNTYNFHNLSTLSESEEGLATALSASTELGDSDRQRLQSMITSELAAKLVAFSLRMATATVRKGDPHYLHAGARALTLDNDVLDPRDVYFALAVLADAGCRISTPVDSILSNVAPNATQLRAIIMIKGFVNGPSYMRSLRSWGVQFEDSDDGPRYRADQF